MAVEIGAAAGKARRGGAEVITCPIITSADCRSEGARGVERQRSQAKRSSNSLLWEFSHLAPVRRRHPGLAHVQSFRGKLIRCELGTRMFVDHSNFNGI
jgi:hypothetical protein